MEYTVELTILTDRPITDEMLEAVAAIAGPAGGTVGKNRLVSTLTVEADSVDAAICTGLRKVSAIAPGELIEGTAARCDEFDRRAAEERSRSELVGISEVAEMLGLPRQRIYEIARDRTDAPQPIQRLKAGPIWRKSDWSTFAASDWRRKGGRPRKRVAEDALA